MNNLARVSLISNFAPGPDPTGRGAAASGRATSKARFFGSKIL